MRGAATVTRYRGRFAPTPSGPLHLGSLLVAVASYLDARSHAGIWLVRIDDIDPPREVPGAAAMQLHQLAAHGLHWDEQERYQSRRHPAYQAAVEQLLKSGDAFYCVLSRRDLTTLGGRHPGPVCAVPAAPDRAVRLTVPEQPICFDDCLQGPQQLNLAKQEGPFVIRRRDGLFAYQLACALDDADDRITHVLRGVDLLDSTHRQLHVLDCLGRPRPCYGHLPVLVDHHGVKLSKSAGSAALTSDAPANLRQTLTLLGLPPPPELGAASCEALLGWAIPHWRSDTLAGRQRITAPSARPY